MQIYIAGRYSRRLELCTHRAKLIEAGFNVQARWLDGELQLSNDGKPIGESGECLVEKSALRSGESLSENELTERASALRAKFANDDFEDVTNANMVISFTEPPRSKPSRGGRHVEFGIALGNRSTIIIVVGHRENIFHWLPWVHFYPDWSEAFAEIVSSFC